MTTRLDDAEVDHRRRAIERAQRALERVTERPPRQAPPDVRTMRRRLAATRELLTLVGDHLELLHDLAHDRTRAAERLRVLGGDRDYALDNHGDPKARALYQQLCWEVLDMIDDGSIAANEIIVWAKTGQPASRRRRASDAAPEDVIAAIEARDRRVARGEGAAPVELQPLPKGPTSAELLAEVSSLRGAIAKLHPTRLAKTERSRLTTLEAAAWERAVPKAAKPARVPMVRPAQRGAPWPEKH